jgi:hypothetical protein
VGGTDDLEDEHDGREPDEDRQPFLKVQAENPAAEGEGTHDNCQCEGVYRQPPFDFRGTSFLVSASANCNFPVPAPPWANDLAGRNDFE